MPIWLRKFTLYEMNEYYDNEKKQYENTKSQKKGNTSLVSPDGTVNKANFNAASKPYKGKTSYK